MSVTVTSTELETDLEHYLDLLAEGFIIFITRNGKISGKLTSAITSPVDAITGILEGKLPDDYDADTIRKEKLEHT